MNPNILDVIACPICKGKLCYDKNAEQLICKFHKVAFPIKNGIPIMLIEEATPIEIKSIKSQKRG